MVSPSLVRTPRRPATPQWSPRRQPATSGHTEQPLACVVYLIGINSYLGTPLEAEEGPRVLELRAGSPPPLPRGATRGHGHPRGGPGLQRGAAQPLLTHSLAGGCVERAQPWRVRPEAHPRGESVRVVTPKSTSEWKQRIRYKNRALVQSTRQSPWTRPIHLLSVPRPSLHAIRHPFF